MNSFFFVLLSIGLLLYVNSPGECVLLKDKISPQEPKQWKIYPRVKEQKICDFGAGEGGDQPAC